MSRDARNRALWIGVCVTLGAAVYFLLQRHSSAPPNKTISEKPAPATPPPLARIPAEARRDAAYWPQQAAPVVLRSRSLMPSTDLPAEIIPDEPTDWVVQFGGPLDAPDRAALAALGIELNMPTVACAFHARATFRKLQAARDAFVPRILGWVRCEPADRLLPELLSDERPAYAMEDNGMLKRRLELYPHADVKSLATAVQALGGRVLNVERAANVAGVTTAVEVSGPPAREFSLKLAAIGGVYAVGLPRPQKRVCNEESANASNVPEMLAAPYNLTGSGVTVLVRDQAAIFNHPDYSPRLTLGPDVVSEIPAQHSTHVAGTIGGTGLADVSALARGMARSCTLVSFDLAGDDVNEPLQAKNSFSAIISNHSYGFVIGWDNGVFNNNQADFGSYSSFSRNWDALVRTESVVLIKAVGNDRNDTGPGNPHDGTLGTDGEYYDTADSSSTAKNILTVGAVQDGIQAGVPVGSTVVLPGSSSGPTNDGRVRPEILANGDNVNSCNNDATPGSEYARLSGTSMACAVVTGATALFMEQYKKRFSSVANAPAHYLRAVYAQTATDMGRPGPDYLHGFGMLDVKNAINLFDADSATPGRIISATLDAQSPERFYVINSDGVSPIKATLCWTDEPGDILAARSIVNDLDLRLIRASDQTIFFPFVLNAGAPHLNATTGTNTVDTIEQILLQAPPAGEYLLSVRGTTLASPVNFTLASTHVGSENLAPVARITSSNTSGMPPFPVTFDASASSDPDGSISRYIWDFGDGTTAEGAQVQHTFDVGSFRATLKVVDDRGGSATSSVIIAVDNKPPVAVLSISPSVGIAPLSSSLSSFGSYDLDGLITSFRWDLGDGTIATTPLVSKTYTAPGLYFVTLTITDSGNATATRTATVLAGQTLPVKSSKFSLNFAKLSLDRFSLSSRSVPVPATMQTAGLTGSLRVGTSDFFFQLDEKGKFTSPQMSVRFTPSRASLTINLKNVNLVTALAKTGAINTDISGVIITVPYAITFSDGTSLGSTGLPYVYKATQGKSGKGSLYVPK
ncbi:MAG TPA: PKD domain-containing protein [Planctomycetota bacterium]|nr:PKD domain-containing protein [Planctomycetota bacterium]